MTWNGRGRSLPHRAALTRRLPYNQCKKPPERVHTVAKPHSGTLIRRRNTGYLFALPEALRTEGRDPLWLRRAWGDAVGAPCSLCTASLGGAQGGSMDATFSNVYDDGERARAYAALEFPGTYYLAFRDLPALVREHARGSRALDFGCGAGRSSRFLRGLGLEVIGVDISVPMLEQARARDPQGDYRLVPAADLAPLESATFDIILAAFTFDNIPTDERRTTALRALRRLLAAQGRLIIVVSSPAIYVNEWASFSTRDFPTNRGARDGDTVRCVMLDVPDRRPVEDVVCGDARYRELFARAGLGVVDTLRPLATGSEGVRWVSETTIPPWTIYVLGAV